MEDALINRKDVLAWGGAKADSSTRKDT